MNKDKILNRFYESLLSGPFSSVCKEVIKNHYTNVWCSGIKKNGEKCLKKAIDNSIFCGTHAKPFCIQTITAGLNKGLPCGNSVHEGTNFCSKHLIRKKVVVIDDDDDDNVEPIVKVSAPINEPIVKVSAPINEPIVKVSEPIIEPAAPIIEPAAPINEPAAPINEPIVKVSAPINEPIVKVSAPINEPIVKTSAPIIEPSAPIIEPSAPIIEPSAPIIEPSASIIEPAAPMPGRIDNHIVVSRITQFPNSSNGCRAMTNKQLCGKPVKGLNKLCSKHKELNSSVSELDIEKYLPQSLWIKGNFWNDLVNNYNWKLKSDSIQTRGLRENELSRDDDSLIDNNTLPWAKHETCMYSCEELCPDKRVVTVCDEPNLEGFHVCKKHKKFETKMFCRRILDPQDYRSVVALHFPSFLGGYWQFKQLGLFSHLTKNGLIVVGKLWKGTHAEQLNLCKVERNMCYRAESENIETDDLGGHSFIRKEDLEKHKKRFVYDNNPTEDEDDESLILRCHNNGLLYKILPQEHLLYQYDITNLDSLPGKGFVSFEQMIRDRPTLYIKYWNVWNGHIKRVREWLTFRNKTPLQIWEETGITSWINWDDIEAKLPEYGAYNIVIPAPDIEQVKSAEFNPFRYCKQWTEDNCPDQLSRPHFPPMYILYPFPDEEYMQHKKANMAEDVSSIARRNPKLLEHYNFSVLTENAYTFMQALKYGNPNTFPFTSSDVPYRLWNRLGYKKWSERFNCPPLIQK